jgi:hypothetical protein
MTVTCLTTSHAFFDSLPSKDCSSCATHRVSLPRPNVSELRPLDPELLVKSLAAHDVAYVLIGAMAARLQGFARMTADADITPARDKSNLIRLASALRDLNARVYTDGVPDGLAFDVSAATLARAEIWNLVTDAGRLDIVFTPAGTTGYADLISDAVRFRVFGVDIEAARLEDILRSKAAADRPQDRQDVLLIRQMLDAKRQRESDSR